MTNNRLLAYLAIIALAIGLVGTVLILTTSTPKPQPSKPTPSPTAATQRLISVLPPGRSANISTTTKISASFLRPLSSSEQELVSFQVTPLIEGVIGWGKDNRTVTFTPNQPLQNNQKYDIKVTFPADEFSWNFTTEAVGGITMEEEKRLQIIADRNFGQMQIEVLQSYPW